MSEVRGYVRKSIYGLMHNRLNNDQTFPQFSIANKFSCFPMWNVAKILERVRELRRADHVQLYVNQACCGSVNLTTGIARQLSMKASNSELLKNYYHLFRL
jgi:hypothetical protein